ncbi:hypothetical protein MKZ38_010736 [Zalerion maritima]|uniref:Uncharacterized protein n=1 Tax=Zalerion maritima TaxID=339359 RepID=A0AAD5S027_9PEZI|nr:hypothetical protein MKZ38_010736 [Zalerion maritima]
MASAANTIDIVSHRGFLLMKQKELKAAFLRFASDRLSRRKKSTSINKLYKTVDAGGLNAQTVALGQDTKCPPPAHYGCGPTATPIAENARRKPAKKSQCRRNQSSYANNAPAAYTGQQWVTNIPPPDDPQTTMHPGQQTYAGFSPSKEYSNSNNNNNKPIKVDTASPEEKKQVPNLITVQVEPNSQDEDEGAKQATATHLPKPSLPTLPLTIALIILTTSSSLFPFPPPLCIRPNLL